jgi:hypothetical protein
MDYAELVAAAEVQKVDRDDISLWQFDLDPINARLSIEAPDEATARARMVEFLAEADI